MIRVDLGKLVKDGDRRNYFRVCPAAAEPVVIKTSIGEFKIIEISGGGCRLPAAAAPGLKGSVVLELPAGKKSAKGSRIPLQVRVANHSVESVGVEFIELAESHRELICDYVLRREIELARQKRAQKLQ
jgi:c-di-GMP-binding flagellar brake protein YcgR